MTSIRRWLLGWLIAGLAVAALIAAYGIFYTAQEEANELFDYELRTVALSVPATIAGTNGFAQRGPDFDGLADDRLFIEVWDGTGRSVYRSLAGVDVPRFPPGLRTIEYDEFHWRIFGVQEGDRFVQAAQPMSVRQDLARHLALRTLWPLAVFLPVIVLIVLFVVRRGLAPIGGISRALATRSFDSLEPLHFEGRLPVEMQPLVDALNDLLHRLNVASQSQRTFVGDAAHELRSPLAALKLQLQAAERDGSLVGSKQTFERIEGRLNRLIHLVHQLLTMAREDAQRSAHFEPVSLRRLCERAVADFSMLAEARQIDLGLEFNPSGGADDAYKVNAEAHGIEVLLNNLIDNAIRYTPHGGKVDVILERSGDEVSICVSDSGPGVPDAERERVFDRFYRSAGNKVHGSGLGLAIAMKIAQRHHATLSMSNNESGVGLRVTLAGLHAQ
ncbi:ATP-binding protein [Paraburkholderia phymatum]|uniref:histidine kinase n=1 Tax=Paraburkholderia phymatum (strain DSM 17167 / CIP 108236 / LMG 21445 / STM815) TaxID=391038 RepID=B2JP84_PARP8|nr:ATP-binding protein [Paraburkholderia phymatum]ACC73087.1 integral membrane sensor signal transduction histidine kinase [Paraburkholderia phymatum STM815]